MSLQVPKPISPTLPVQQPSATARVFNTAMTRTPPRPGSRPSSLSQHRPPHPPVARKAAPPSISIVDKLIKTCPVWLQLGIAQDRAVHILNKEPPGIFLVRRDAGQMMVVVMRLPDQQGEPHVQEVCVKEEKALLHLEGSVLVFDNIFKLIAFYCVSRDILPFTLKLPQAIIQATKYEDMEVISTLGLGTDSLVQLVRSPTEGFGHSYHCDTKFWGSTLNCYTQENESAGAKGKTSRSSSCEIQLSAERDHLWYVNPVFIEEYCKSLLPGPPTPILRTQSLNTPIQAPPRYKRPPPLPPRPLNVSEGSLIQLSDKSASEQLMSLESTLCSPPTIAQKEEGNQSLCPEVQGPLTPIAKSETVEPQLVQTPQTEAKKHTKCASSNLHLVPLRQMSSEKHNPGEEIQQNLSESNISGPVQAVAEGQDPLVPLAPLISLDDNSMAEWESPENVCEQSVLQHEKRLIDHSDEASTVTSSPRAEVKKPHVPVPPPRRKRLSQAVTSDTFGETTQELTSLTLKASTCEYACTKAGNAKALDVSLYPPVGDTLQQDPDSFCVCSTEEDMDNMAMGGLVKRAPTIMLDRAKQRLSMVNFSTVFTSFMSADRKLQKRIVELARDGTTYFGNLVHDYRYFTLDTMQKHTSSMEMLQEIRQMMTQLKSYLIQSTELQNLQEPVSYSEERLEIIIEAALCKSVLKPLRQAIYDRLKDIHSRGGTIKRLKENQQVVLGTTSTALGVTTSVPDTPVMEKIQVKMGNLHQEYSPQKKIDLLLKTCKIIYESMSVGSPGRAHGADDFLPVLMYVLARCNMTALLLDVEYMMELMDPALQLGEGSYYLTTTYGALEHIKNYDKQAITKQLSLEIQDSIHRWERRRTLNKARASRSSIQDFINISFLEAGLNIKTLSVHPNTTAQDLCDQCAVKFEVLEPNSYCLSVLVDGNYCSLTSEQFPLTIKSSLLNADTRKEYYFVYHQKGKEFNSQTFSTPEIPPV